MLKTYEKIKNLKKEKYKSPKTIQDIIPFDFLYKDGTFQKGMKTKGFNAYSKTYFFDDVNFLNVSKDQCEAFFLAYVDVLNSFDSLVLSKIKITIERWISKNSQMIRY